MPRKKSNEDSQSRKGAKRKVNLVARRLSGVTGCHLYYDRTICTPQLVDGHVKGNNEDLFPHQAKWKGIC
jgi:hypothetical protein